MHMGTAAHVRNSAWKGRVMEDDETLRRIADALERLAPPDAAACSRSRP
jgi:hypothetical protein